MSGNQDDFAGIGMFLSEHQNRKMHNPATSSAHDAYYDDDYDRYPAPSAAASSRSRTDRSSAVFSHSHRGRRSSYVMSESTEVTEAPERNEIPQLEFGAYHHVPVSHTASDSQSFPCEFDIYTGCTAMFRLNEVTYWIDHTVQHFELAGLPTVCLCWYCDEWGEFNAVNHGGDKRVNFQNRMLHISNHFPENTGRDARSRRADPWVVDHLWKKGVISRAVFERETSRHEMSQIPGLLSAGEQSPIQLRRSYVRNSVHHDMAREERRWRRHQRGSGT